MSCLLRHNGSVKEAGEFSLIQKEKSQQKKYLGLENFQFELTQAYKQNQPCKAFLVGNNDLKCQ